jgi:hypothetical protein
MVCKLIHLKQIIKFHVAVFFSNMSYVRFLGLNHFVGPCQLRMPWALCLLRQVDNPTQDLT